MPTPNIATKATAIGRRSRTSCRRIGAEPAAACGRSRGSVRHSSSQASSGSAHMPYSGAARLNCASHAAAAGPSTRPTAPAAPKAAIAAGRCAGGTWSAINAWPTAGTEPKKPPTAPRVSISAVKLTASGGSSCKELPMARHISA